LSRHGSAVTPIPTNPNSAMFRLVVPTLLPILLPQTSQRSNQHASRTATKDPCVSMTTHLTHSPGTGVATIQRKFSVRLCVGACPGAPFGWVLAPVLFVCLLLNSSLFGLCFSFVVRLPTMFLTSAFYARTVPLAPCRHWYPNPKYCTYTARALTGTLALLLTKVAPIVFSLLQPSAYKFWASRVTSRAQHTS
jgi:hypothetical protein